MNNIMKKLILTLGALFIIGAIFSQSASVLPWESAVGVLKPSLTLTHTLPQIMAEYDVSIQMDPRDGQVSGSFTDSGMTYIVYQSNSLGDNVWTALGAAATITTGALDTDALYTITDFKGLRLKLIYTATGTDTVNVTTRAVFKKHANE